MEPFKTVAAISAPLPLKNLAADAAIVVAVFRSFAREVVEFPKRRQHRAGVRR